MLLNLSHEITYSGLPQDVQKRYVRYKQGNRAIVAWMTTYGPDKYKGRKTLPIKQMITLGKLLCDKVLEIGSLPPDVDYYFRDVIKERTYLTRHFRDHRDQCERDDIDTVNHEHFTERQVRFLSIGTPHVDKTSLKQIHQILLTAGKSKPGTSARTVGKPKIYTPSPNLTTTIQPSRFSFATSDDDDQSDDSDEDSDNDSDTNATSECSHSPLERSSCMSENSDRCDDLLEAGGPIAQGIETLMFLQRVERISTIIRDCWLKSGSSTTNFAVSAAYTNILIQRAMNYSRDFIDSEPRTISFQSIRQIIKDWYSTTDDDCQHSLFELSEALATIESSLGRSESSFDPQLERPNKSRSDNLIDDLISSLPSNPESCGKSNLMYGWLLSTGVFSHASADTAHQFRKCIALYVVSLSHCGYSETLTKPAYIALPRISALKLANEALSTIRQFISDKSIFPCQCTNTLSYRVIQMHNELEIFAKYKCWSTLMQSPLIAGNQTLEILHLCSYYGMHLFHYRHYVGSVLHSYNALLNLESIDRIPILDEICGLFAPVLFTTGKKPTAGFMASWLRYIGARLSFRNSKKHRNHKDTWCMSVPAHTAARSAGLNISGKNDAAQILPKFDYGTIDSTMRLKHNQWILNIEQDQKLDHLLEISSSRLWDQVLPPSSENPKSRTTSHKSGNKMAKHKRSKSCTMGSLLPSSDQKSSDTDTCSNIHHSILSTFSRDNCSSDDHKPKIPPSRFNLLALFHSMTKIIAGISDATHAEAQPPSSPSSPSSSSSAIMSKGKGQMCLCFAQTILQGADRILDTRKRSGLDAKGAMWSKTEKECVACFKDELLKVLRSDGVLSTECNGSAVVAVDGGKWIWESVI